MTPHRQRRHWYAAQWVQGTRTPPELWVFLAPGHRDQWVAGEIGGIEGHEHRRTITARHWASLRTLGGLVQYWTGLDDDLLDDMTGWTHVQRACLG